MCIYIVILPQKTRKDLKTIYFKVLVGNESNLFCSFTQEITKSLKEWINKCGGNFKTFCKKTKSYIHQCEFLSPDRLQLKIIYMPEDHILEKPALRPIEVKYAKPTSHALVLHCRFSVNSVALLCLALWDPVDSSTTLSPARH